LDRETGTIVLVKPDKRFGFVRSDTRPRNQDLFFHESETDLALAFTDAILELRVTFNVITTPKGLRATNLEAAH
jgi:cold shock CspA family protein